ncbi:MAG: corrinoid protein [Candidatus Cloacimonetes bacterium]|nr:corrinoid protein [Candidatus Cloacimonadota bacterium]
MANFEKMADAVIKGNQNTVIELTEKAVDEGIKPKEIIEKGLINGMNVVGKRFKAGNMFVPEVLMSAKAMKAGMNIVKPLLLEREMSSEGKVLLGTVSGDLHDIGKNLVGMMMESGGLEIVNLGTDISTEEFAAKVKEHNPDVLGMSALLTTTMLSMRDTIEVLEEEGLRDSVKVMVGGAPVTKEFADEIGADGWAPDAASAKDLAFELIKG